MHTISPTWNYTNGRAVYEITVCVSRDLSSITLLRLLAVSLYRLVNYHFTNFHHVLLDIQYSYEWNSECTHLLMRHYKFDYAVLHALAEVKPIINPKWIEHLEVMRDGSLVRMFQLPDETNYLPEAKDEVPRLNIELFKANVKRKTLLSGTVFVLPEEQYVSEFWFNECIDMIILSIF